MAWIGAFRLSLAGLCGKVMECIHIFVVSNSIPQFNSVRTIFSPMLVMLTCL